MSQDMETFFEDIAVSASLAMALEASSYPKPGNVHRLKDFKNTNYEHFLASAIATEFIFKKAAQAGSDPKIGELLWEAVTKSKQRQTGGNTHFGTFLLILPLAAAAGMTVKKNPTKKRTSGDVEEICQNAFEICQKTDETDAFCFYKSFEKLNIPAKKEIESADFDLSDPTAKNRIKTQQIGLFELMKSAAKRDMIAKEWATGFELTNRFSDRLFENNAYFLKNPDKQFKNALNSAIVLTFLEFMAEFPDTFIETKFDEKTAERIQKKAKEIIDSSSKSAPEKEIGNKTGNRIDLNRLIPKINELDDELHAKKINPGSLADIAAAGIFLALFRGLTF
ncbi:triphosphoribosyl-dephospho-CoA synthase [Methanolapillus millepedarum]|uniref:Triphosphoribosyl-dephospho-CoA synthase n=1 Tax=Methanolapillus millepedarum TaxID=3028296 RepID=A0AA96V364_9EURY|nr:hypothetical protein MsAc7_00920 [Methanosarcinaceae archaeon Ac7]